MICDGNTKKTIKSRDGHEKEPRNRKCIFLQNRVGLANIYFDEQEIFLVRQTAVKLK